MGTELLHHKLEALGYGGYQKPSADEELVSRLVADLIEASKAGDSLRKEGSEVELQLQLAQDKVCTFSQTLHSLKDPWG